MTTGSLIQNGISGLSILFRKVHFAARPCIYRHLEGKDRREKKENFNIFPFFFQILFLRSVTKAFIAPEMLSRCLEFFIIHKKFIWVNFCERMLPGN